MNDNDTDWRSDQESALRAINLTVRALTEYQLTHIRALITALRSDEFLQGEGRLTSISQEGVSYHCCLGVGCLVYDSENKDLNVYRRTWSEVAQWNLRKEDPTVILTADQSYNGEFSILPGIVRRWYGFDDSNPDVIITETETGSGVTFKTARSLASLNDRDKWSFAQIADAIENTYIVPRLPVLPDLDHTGDEIDFPEKSEEKPDAS